MNNLSNLMTAASAVVDPTTSAEALTEIARLHRSLWPQIASHVNAHAALLQWLAQYGDEATRNIAITRMTDDLAMPTIPSSQTPAPPTSVPVTPQPEGKPMVRSAGDQKSRRLPTKVIAGVSGGLVTIVVCALVMFLVVSPDMAKGSSPSYLQTPHWSEGINLAMDLDQSEALSAFFVSIPPGTGDYFGDGGDDGDRNSVVDNGIALVFVKDGDKCWLRGVNLAKAKIAWTLDLSVVAGGTEIETVYGLTNGNGRSVLLLKEKFEAIQANVVVVDDQRGKLVNSKQVNGVAFENTGTGLSGGPILRGYDGSVIALSGVVGDYGVAQFLGLDDSTFDVVWSQNFAAGVAWDAGLAAGAADDPSVFFRDAVWYPTGEGYTKLANGEVATWGQDINYTDGWIVRYEMVGDQVFRLHYLGYPEGFEIQLWDPKTNESPWQTSVRCSSEAITVSSLVCLSVDEGDSSASVNGYVTANGSLLWSSGRTTLSPEYSRVQVGSDRVSFPTAILLDDGYDEYEVIDPSSRVLRLIFSVFVVEMVPGDYCLEGTSDATTENCESVLV